MIEAAPLTTLVGEPSAELPSKSCTCPFAAVPDEVTVIVKVSVCPEDTFPVEAVILVDVANGPLPPPPP